MDKKIKQELTEAGSNDTYIEDRLCENAEEFIRQNYPDLPEKDFEEAINAYRQGFFRG